MRKGYQCKCGMYHEFPGYVYAHWDDALTHTCSCGRGHLILKGITTEIKEVEDEKVSQDS